MNLRSLFGRGKFEREMQEEMAEHIDRATERYIARGMSPAEARLAARREFGNVPALQEESRDARGARWIDTLAADARFAFRYFARHKATTAIIVTVFALGTGANTLIFSMVQALFLRPAPAVSANPSHVRIWAQERTTRTADWQPRRFSGPELAALATHPEIFEDVVGYTEDMVVLGGSDSTAPRTVAAQFVTPNYFGALGVDLTAGPGLRQGNGDTPDMTGVMAHAVAERLYGGATAAIGRQVVVNEIPVHIVGVAPPRFQGSLRNMDEPALWIPLSARAEIFHTTPRWQDEESLGLFAKLAPSVPRDRATALVQQVVTTTLPDSAARVGMTRDARAIGMQSPSPGDESTQMVMAISAVGTVGILILLVACTNVSSLMVAAAVGRRHEIAVRLSLGASRARLLWQLVTESTLLASAGSVIGLTLAWWVLIYMMKTEVDGVDLTPDLGTFAFVLVMAVATGVLFGLSPALHATKSGVAHALRDSGTGASHRSRLQRGFVVAQIALSQPLLVMLGIVLSLVVSEYRALTPEMSRHVIAVGLNPVGAGAAGQRPEAVDSLVPRIAARPGVVGAVPDATGFAIRGVQASDLSTGNAGHDTVPTNITLEGVSPGWFEMIEVPIILGRDVAWGDTAAIPVDQPVVIGSDLARAFWGNGNPIGRTLASPSLPGWKQDSIALTVVGVYDATRALPGMTWQGAGATGDKMARVYTARGKQWRRDRVLVKTRGPALPFVPELQAFVRQEAPSLPVTGMLTLAQEDRRENLEALKVALAAGAGGVVALLLASLGLYGVVSLAVRQRTREIGIRIAVGAHPMRVARMFLASGVRVSLVALALGLPLSIAAMKIGIAQGILIAPEVNPYFLGIMIALILVAVASAATWIPARRAALVEPASTLRVE